MKKNRLNEKKELFESGKINVFFENFYTVEISDGQEIYPSVILTVLKSNEEARAYLNYKILGTIENEEKSYFHIEKNYPHLIQNATSFALKMKAKLYFY